MLTGRGTIARWYEGVVEGGWRWWDVRWGPGLHSSVRLGVRRLGGGIVPPPWPGWVWSGLGSRNINTDWTTSPHWGRYATSSSSSSSSITTNKLSKHSNTKLESPQVVFHLHLTRLLNRRNIQNKRIEKKETWKMLEKEICQELNNTKSKPRQAIT